MRALAAEFRTPLQTGENLVDTFELINYGIEMSSHLFPEYSAHLLAVTFTSHWLESMDWATPIVAEPLQIKDGHVVIPDRPSSGITWNEDAARRCAVTSSLTPQRSV